MSQIAASQAGALGCLALEQSNDLVFVLDQRLRFLYVNDTTCRTLGFAREDLLAANAAVIGMEDPGAHFPGTGARAGWSIGERYTAEMSLLSRGGRVIPVEISVRVIEYDGQPLQLIVARDIGERKRLQEKANARIATELA